MKYLLFVLFALNSTNALATSPNVRVQQLNPKEGQKAEQKKSCELKISFGSYGSGTPTKVIKEINEILSKSKDIKDFKSWGWGMEGEFDYCLDFNSNQALKKMHQMISDAVPDKSKDGYTRIFLNGVMTKQTTWPN